MDKDKEPKVHVRESTIENVEYWEKRFNESRLSELNKEENEQTKE